jgi:hypothetical protein
LLKKYSSIAGYLERYSLFKLGKLHIRIHHILSSDGTPYCHNHPFHYVSIILKGGYTEQIIHKNTLIEKKYRVGSIIIRSAHTHHRIKKAVDCKTLFFAWRIKQKWSLQTHAGIECRDYQKPLHNGIYLRMINGKEVYCKFDNFWFIGSDTIEKALLETRLSIYQVGAWEEI